jgi:hypothetical protein
MARKAFYSFHYDPDNWRASKVRNMGVIEKNPLASSNKGESYGSCHQPQSRHSSDI